MRALAGGRTGGGERASRRVGARLRGAWRVARVWVATRWRRSAACWRRRWVAAMRTEGAWRRKRSERTLRRWAGVRRRRAAAASRRRRSAAGGGGGGVKGAGRRGGEGAGGGRGGGGGGR